MMYQVKDTGRTEAGNAEDNGAEVVVSREPAEAESVFHWLRG